MALVLAVGGAAEVRRGLGRRSSGATMPGTWPRWARPPRRPRRARRWLTGCVLVGMMGAGKTTVGRDAGPPARLALPRLRRPGRGDRPARPCPSCSPPGARTPSGPRSPGSWPRPSPTDPPAVVSAAGGVGAVAGQPGRCWPPPAPWSGCGPTRRRSSPRVGCGRGSAAARTTTRPRRWPISTPSGGRSTARWPTWSSTWTSSLAGRGGGRPDPGGPTGLRPAERGPVIGTVPVELGERAYEVVVGEGARHEFGPTSWPRPCPAARRAVVVTQDGHRRRRWTPGCPTRCHRPRRRVGQVARRGRGPVPRGSPGPG